MPGLGFTQPGADQQLAGIVGRSLQLRQFIRCGQPLLAAHLAQLQQLFCLLQVFCLQLLRQLGGAPFQILAADGPGQPLAGVVSLQLGGMSLATCGSQQGAGLAPEVEAVG